MLGKYMPTQASKAKKAATIAARGREAAGPADVAYAAAPMAIDPRPNIALVEVSVETPILPSCPKMVEPRRQDAMKQEKTVPYGVAAPDPNARLMAALMAGGHCNTKMYMAASKRL